MRHAHEWGLLEAERDMHLWCREMGRGKWATKAKDAYQCHQEKKLNCIFILQCHQNVNRLWLTWIFCALELGFFLRYQFNPNKSVPSWEASQSYGQQVLQRGYEDSLPVLECSSTPSSFHPVHAGLLHSSARKCWAVCFYYSYSELLNWI